jgi:hypothetical protein
MAEASKAIDAKLLEPYRKDDGTLNHMMESGMALTRANYIGLNWAGQIPSPWTSQHEEELPEPLQDWSRVRLEPPPR